MPKNQIKYNNKIQKWTTVLCKFTIWHGNRDLLWAWLWSLVWVDTVRVLMNSEVSKRVKLFVALVTAVWHLVLVKSDVFQKRIELLKTLATRLHNALVYLDRSAANHNMHTICKMPSRCSDEYTVSCIHELDCHLQHLISGMGFCTNVFEHAKITRWRHCNADNFIIL